MNLSALKKEASDSSEQLIYINQITRRHTPQITYEYRLLKTEVRGGLMPIDYTISFSNSLQEIMFRFLVGLFR